MSENDPSRDRDLGMHRSITRRDFLNGVAIGAGAAAASSLWPSLLLAEEQKTFLSQDKPDYYPPSLTGMRGSHDGSFTVAHSLRYGTFWKNVGTPTDTKESYDLVVVGGGISGLAAAYFYRAKNSSARILILDNHDDFGGHAKRNEFRPGGRLLLGNGGTWAVESSFPYSKEAKALMDSLGIDPPALESKCDDRELYHDLHPAHFYDKETFGVDRLTVGSPQQGWRGRKGSGLTWAEYMAKSPLSSQAQADVVRIETEHIDHMAGMTEAQKKDKLSRMSYKDYLLKAVKVHPHAALLYQTFTHGLYGVGIDAVPALDCWAIRAPGFQGLNLQRVPSPRLSFTAEGEVTPKPPYFFHFPDGNASIARLLVRSLIPKAVPGSTVDDVVTAIVDYSKLDEEVSPVRVRLNSTVVRVKHAGDLGSSKEVEVTYASGKQAYTVRGKNVVLACWHMVIPYMCPELPAKQREAMHYGVKVPIVYTTVAVGSGASMHKLGAYRVNSPGMYHSEVTLDEPISIGDYKFPRSPDYPILLRMLRCPCQPGLSPRDQQRIGHYDLYGTTFETFERKIRDQLARVLSSGDFDPARDIDAITVNRWPHGYAYEYNPLWDPDWPEGQRPCDIARKPFGRITIANSDAAAAAYTDQAIDQAYRAIQELKA